MARMTSMFELLSELLSKGVRIKVRDGGVRITDFASLPDDIKNTIQQNRDQLRLEAITNAYLAEDALTEKGFVVIFSHLTGGPLAIVTGEDVVTPKKIPRYTLEECVLAVHAPQEMVIDGYNIKRAFGGTLEPYD